MSILVYHGSSRLFEQFVIDPKLAVTSENSLVEGYGVYLTENKKLAKAIGEYTYEVSIEESDLTDMTNRRFVDQLIRKTLRAVHPSLTQFVNIDLLVNQVLSGDMGVVRLKEELVLQLDSREEFYKKFGDQVTYEDDCFMEKVRNSYLDHVGNVFKYYDKSYGHNNLICFRNPECLRIVNITKEGQ